MTVMMHRIFAIALIAALTLTGHQAAMARGAHAGVDTIVICVGQTVVQVSVDADGQPVQSVHLCPDAALSLFAFADAGLSGVAVLRDWHTVPADRRLVRAANHAAPQAQARDPPGVV